MEEIDKEIEKIDQKQRKLIKIVKIPRLVQISGKNTQIPRRKPKSPDLVKKGLALVTLSIGPIEGRSFKGEGPRDVNRF